MKNKKMLNIMKYTIKSLLIGVTVFSLIIVIISLNTDRVQERNLFGNRFFVVLSDSMVPIFETGDLIIAKEVETDTLQEGDIITFHFTNGEVVTHKIYDITTIDDKRAFITKGDNNEEIDEQYIFADQVIGKYSMKIPKLGLIIDFFKSTIGFIIFIAIPLFIVIVLNLIKIVRLVKTMRKEKLAERIELNEQLEAERERYRQMEQELQSLKAKIESGNRGESVVI